MPSSLKTPPAAPPSVREVTRQRYLQIARRIRAIREDRGLSQRECADHLDITRSAYSYYESERGHQIDIVKLSKLADLFDTTLDELVGRRELPDRPADSYQARLAQLSPADQRTLRQLFQRVLSTYETEPQQKDLHADEAGAVRQSCSPAPFSALAPAGRVSH